eukprot:3412445-Rhodomonas_salina.2
MHTTDLKSGESMEKEEEAMSAAPTQPAQNNESEVGGADQVGTFQDELTDMLAELKKQVQEIQVQESRQLRKRVLEMETSTGADLGTTPTDNVPTNTTIQDRKLRQHYLEWTNGAQVPLAAEIDLLNLKDPQLGRCLAHHQFMIKYLADWFPPEMSAAQDGHLMVKRCWSSKGKHYVYCDVLEQIEKGERKNYVWWLRKLLDTVFDEPKTLEDVSLKLTLVEQVNQTLLNLWCCAPTLAAPPLTTDEDSESGESEPEEPVPESLTGPFHNEQRNKVWRALASQMMEHYEELADVDMLEPNPSTRNEAMCDTRLHPFWIDSERKEMEGLWSRGCFKQWKRSELLASDRVFGSRFHYNIKRNGVTGQITNCKVQLVVMGNRMREGEDYEDSFAPVPHATSGSIIISITAAQDLELHSCDLAQAFIQADKLDEGVNGWIFIRPPQGAVKDADTRAVFEVCRPLYGIPSSARALHLTLSRWFKEQGFTTAGFEDSVWVGIPTGIRGQICSQAHSECTHL